MDKKALETAIVSIARSAESLAAFKSDPAGNGAQYGLEPDWAQAIGAGDRDRLRAAGVSDGITILVSRWFRDDLGDSASTGGFRVDPAARVPEPRVPDNIVFAAGCSHVPDLLARPEIDPADAVARLQAGYARLRDDLAAARPDSVVVMADCHFQSFETGAIVVGAAAQHTGSMAFFKRPDIAMTLQGAPALAQAIVQGARQAGLEVEQAPRVDLDHGLIVPLRQLLPRPDLPVVPVITQPARTFSPFGARAFGEMLGQVIAASGQRVAVLGTGGLSHWLDPGKFGCVDLEFDRYILDLLRAGQGLNLAQLEPYALLGHGQYELLNWMIMLAAIGPGVRGEVYAYEPMTASGGGWAVVNMRLPQRQPQKETLHA